MTEAIAGGIPVERLYRALLDPADNFFPLERKHILRFDIDEWERTMRTSWVAVRHALARLATRRDAAERAPWMLYLLEQVDRLNDSLPAGLLTLDRYERFLAEFFLRRSIHVQRVRARQLRYRQSYRIVPIKSKDRVVAFRS